MTGSGGAGLLDAVRQRLAASGSEPTPARVAAALRAQGRLLGDAEVLGVAEELRCELIGTGPLEPLLADPDVTDVLVSAPDRVWVDRGVGLERAPVSFTDAAAVRRLAQRLAAVAGRRLDDARPWVDARLPDGTRMHAVLPPVAVGSTCLSLRVVRPRAFTLEELAAAGTVPPGGAPILRALIDARVSYLVSGGTGTGKTTLLASLLGLVGERERIVLAEDSAELRPDHPHVVRLEARPANQEGAGLVTLRDLVRQALRMRPDRLVVGEVRGGEAVDLLAALNTGHEGGSGTLHANTAADVLGAARSPGDCGRARPGRPAQPVGGRSVGRAASRAGRGRAAADRRGARPGAGPGRSGADGSRAPVERVRVRAGAGLGPAEVADRRGIVSTTGVPVRDVAQAVAAVCAVAALWEVVERRRATGRARLVLGGGVSGVPGALGGRAVWSAVAARWWAVLRGRRAWLCLPVAGVVALLGESPLPLIAGAVAVPVVGRRLREAGRRREGEARAERVVALCGAVVGELRAGWQPAQALAFAARETGALGDEEAAVLAAARFGGDVPEALRGAAGQDGADGLSGMAACWQVAVDGARAWRPGSTGSKRPCGTTASSASGCGPNSPGPGRRWWFSRCCRSRVSPSARLWARTRCGCCCTRRMGLGCLAVGGALEAAGLWWAARIVRAGERT